MYTFAENATADKAILADGAAMLESDFQLTPTVVPAKKAEGAVGPRMARLEGTLVVSTPGGPLEIKTLFDTGSEADAVSFDKAIELKQQGVGWGESGGSLVVASGGEVQPAGSLKLLLTAEPGKVSTENVFKIPRSLTFLH